MLMVAPLSIKVFAALVERARVMERMKLRLSKVSINKRLVDHLGSNLK